MEGIDPTWVMEAWILANGRWKDVLRFLAKNEKYGTNRVPKNWFRTLHKNGSRRYYCRICGVCIVHDCRKYPRTKRAYEALSDHGGVHLEEVRSLLRIDNLPKEQSNNGKYKETP